MNLPKQWKKNQLVCMNGWYDGNYTGGIIYTRVALHTYGTATHVCRILDTPVRCAQQQ